MAGKWIYWYEELRREHTDLVGKKCANLGEMTGMGLRVPPGFALSVDAYTTFMFTSGVAQEIKEYLTRHATELESIQGLTQVSQHLRALVESQPLPETMCEQVTQHYRELRSRCAEEDVRVSTRSAGPASHPGQYETYLNVCGEEEILKKIVKVWSSTFNRRSLAARRKKGLPLDSDPIGVAVLKMVDAKAAGVIFTADPNTGNRSRMIIEANWGLGESVVSGQSTPDVYVVDKNSLEIIDRKTGSKEVCVVCTDEGVCEERTTDDRKSALCLTDDEVREVALLGKQLEDYFGVPQDAEWAVDTNLQCPESVILLQTRPEIMVQQKDPVDQVLDFMMERFGM